MEEDSKVIGTDNSQIAEEELDSRNLSLIPSFSSRYDDKGVENKEGDIIPCARIANALTESIIATPKSIEKKYGLTISDETIKKAVDSNGKIQKLSAMQKGVLIALEYQLSLLREKESVKNYIEQLKDKENPKENLKEFIPLEAICANINGQEERWKSDKQERIKKELKALSETKQLHIYKAEVKDRSGNSVEGLIKEFYPYINLTGRERHIQVGRKTSISVEIEFSRIFLERTWDRYYLLPSSSFEAVGSNGRRISTDEYKSLHILVMNRAWSHYHHDLPKAEEYIKEEGILDPDKINQIKERALTHSPIPFSELQTMLEKGMKHREEKRRFKYFLWEAMWALININVLSEKSRINDNETFTLVYSENPSAPRNSKPSGLWERNPFPYKK